MKTRSVPRSLAVVVLIVTLAAASAPTAWALPAPPTGSHAPAWDLGSLFEWLQGVFGGWFGGGGGGAEMDSITDQAGNILEPDGVAGAGTSPTSRLGGPTASPSGSL